MAAPGASDESEVIANINVTPLVDVMLVLLVVLMVTAGYIVARSIPMDLPKAATGESSVTTVAISIDKSGALYLDAAPVTEYQLRERLRQERTFDVDLRAIVAADGDLPHRAVVHVIDVLREEGVTRFAINVQPIDAVPGGR
jgi:biopolymer transport protein ExbD